MPNAAVVRVEADLDIFPIRSGEYADLAARVGQGVDGGLDRFEIRAATLAHGHGAATAAIFRFRQGRKQLAAILHDADLVAVDADHREAAIVVLDAVRCLRPGN